MYKAIFIKTEIIVDDTESINELYNKSCFGSPKDGRLILSLVEALYLLEKSKIEVYDYRNKKLNFKSFLKKAIKIESGFWVRYVVYKDIRTRGYITKTALRFGADFRIYDRGAKPGEEHAKWLLFCVNEGETFTWQKFAAMNRVAHSTKKRLLIGIVDQEGDVTYYEISWKRP